MLRHDLRTALRALLHRPGSTAAAVLTLGLGVGASTALLGMVDHVLLRPLAYGDAGSLYSVWGVTPSYDRVQPSHPDFLDWREGVESLELAFAYGEVFAVRSPEGVEQVTGSAVSPDFFRVMRTPAAVGRTFAADEEREGAPVVVLSHGYWQRRFGGDPAAVGRDVVLGGTPHTVVGVMPPGFEYPEWSSLWVPLARVYDGVPGLRQRDARVDTRAIARVAGGGRVEAAESELRAVAARLAEAHPETNAGLSLRLSPLAEELVGEVRGSLLLMLMAGALVLLLTCANVAAILLGRGLERSRELAVRRALGAERGRLVRLLVAENLVLAGIGGALGTVLAVVAVRLMARSAVAAGVMTALPLPRLTELGVDARLLAVAVGVTAVAALVFGVAPAVLATAGDPARRLREQGRSGEVGRRAVGAQGVLAVVQLAIAVALLAGAALLVRTLEELRRAEPGFRPEGLVVLRVFPQAGAGADERLALYDRLAERAGAVAGVTGAALINHMPFAGGRVPTEVSGIGGAAADSAVGALYRTVSPGFFDVAGARMVRGRGFDAAEAAADVAVLSESLARALWPGGDPVGRYIRLVNPTPPSERRGEVFAARVVGVVADMRNAPREDFLPTVYLPHARDPWGNIFVLARAAGGEAGAVIAPLRRSLAEVDASLPVAELQPLSQRVRDATRRERVFTRLMLGFAALALALSVVGTYGALSNLVLRRTRELGIRIALGARPADVRGLVLRRALMILLLGLAFGGVAAVALARVMESLLFGVTPGDPASFLAAGGLLGLAGLLAAWLPARRAARVDPVELLTSE